MEAKTCSLSGNIPATDGRLELIAMKEYYTLELECNALVGVGIKILIDLYRG